MGLTHLDAGVVIGFLDPGDLHHSTASQLVRTVAGEGDRLAMSASVLAETLVGPFRRGPAAVDLVHRFVATVPVDVVPMTAEIAATAAGLRASHPSLRLPDALVIATAADGGADRLATTDRGWPGAAALDLDLDIVVL
ncbi:MAG: PIN domain-containing protein [Actinomycetota bacterium]